jgi:hypothetical protein
MQIFYFSLKFINKINCRKVFKLLYKLESGGVIFLSDGLYVLVLFCPLKSKVPLLRTPLSL